MTRRNGSARFQLGGGERARQTLAAVASSRRCDGSTAFSNARGQVVGSVQDGWLTKRVDSSAHQLRKPPAWCVDSEHLDRLEAMGATGVLLIDEAGTEWRATVAAFRRYGVPINRGHGIQIALPLVCWRKTVPGQLSLFSEVT